MSGCASKTSIAYMDTIKPVFPSECKTYCSVPPSLNLDPHNWALNVFEWGAECDFLHKACVNGLNKDIENEGTREKS